MPGPVSPEELIEEFWSTHPCGENLVPLEPGAYADFFARYDALRYGLERHIPGCLDRLAVAGNDVLEIGLGQGADSEQLIRRGARWSGLDLTQTSVDRVRTRLALRGLPHEGLAHGSVLAIPYPDAAFDLVYSHGVLHHVPEIERAQREIARVLRPGGRLVVMVYARYSLNYLVSIAVLRRAGLLALALAGVEPRGIIGEHVRRARAVGLRRYLATAEWVSRNTDGPGNPYSRVYSARELAAAFPAFRVVATHKEYMHAPPLPVRRLPGARWLGWHLWAHLVRR